MMSRCLKLCLVTKDFSVNNIVSYKKFLENAVLGGVTSVQLRLKNSNLSEIRSTAFEIKSLLDTHGIPLLINDHVSIAKEINAAGVHLGQSDVTPQIAREILGKDKIIGLSIETFAQLEKANYLDCIDYVAASAVFYSKTKQNCQTYWGIEGLEWLVKHSKFPVVGIGGINRWNIKRVVDAGAQGVAVIGAIHDYPDAKLATEQLLERMANTHTEKITPSQNILNGTNRITQIR